jgi:6-phosphogluconolactonase
VPPDHPDSNYRMADEAMLSRVAVPRENLHRVRGEEPDAAAAAARYEAEMRGFFRTPSPALPRFDLLLLGLGADGHTASLFPGSAAIDDTVHLVRAVRVEPGGTSRITLTPPVLNNAASIVFVVSGSGKAAALRAVLEGSDPPARVPARVINPAQGALLWLVDRKAAAGLHDGGASPTAADSGIPV